MPTIEELLELAADLERFAPGDDALGALIDRVGDDELAIDDLDQIAAAASRPDYAAFLERLDGKKNPHRKL